VFALRVELATRDGKMRQALGRIGSAGSTVLTGSTPAGRFRPVVRGVMRLSGVERPFVVCGPLAEGLPPREIAALRAQERPPVFLPGSGPRIGVYAGGLGAETVIEGLSKQ